LRGISMPENTKFPAGVADAEGLLSLKLEYVILTLLLHYGGAYEDSFLEWYSAVKLAVPQLSDPQRLRDAFQRLSKQGIIELRRPASGSHSGKHRDSRDFFLDHPFIAALTSEGLFHWVAIRVSIKQHAAEMGAAEPVGGKL